MNDGVNQWTPIDYRDFWDVPRMFLVDRDDGVLLFDCPFDDETEDFCDEYQVYLLSSLSDEDLEGSWHEFPARATHRLGSIPVNGVIFDRSRRQAVLTTWLDRVVRNLERRSTAET